MKGKCKENSEQERGVEKVGERGSERPHHLGRLMSVNPRGGLSGTIKEGAMESGQLPSASCMDRPVESDIQRGACASEQSQKVTRAIPEWLECPGDGEPSCLEKLGRGCWRSKGAAPRKDDGLPFFQMHQGMSGRDGTGSIRISRNQSPQ